MKKIVIRKATGEDETALVDVLRTVNLSGEAWTGDEDWVKNILQETPLAPQGFTILVAELDHRIIGFISYVVFPSLWECSKQGLIVDFFVSSIFQGKGVGSKLVETLKAIADADGIRELHVSTGRGNRNAFQFYRRHGFTEEHLLLEHSSSEE